MSQRLLICLEKNIVRPADDRFDCIYTENGTLKDLLVDWLCIDCSGFYLGPWKISIRDYDFFDKFCEDFERIKECCSKLSSFDDVWGIWDDKTGEVVHISKKENDIYECIINAVLNHEDLRQ